MIVIKGNDFKMEQVKASPFFDLSIMTPVNEGKDNERLELKLWGYGMSFEHAVKCIIANRLANINKTVTLVEYLGYYKKMIDGFISSIKVEIIDKKVKDVEDVEDEGELEE